MCKDVSCCGCNCSPNDNGATVEPTEDQNVFCIKCAYFNACKRQNLRTCYDGNYTHETCNAPQNIRPTYMSDGSNKYISSPSVINKFNNCKWFTPNTKPSDAETFVDDHNKNHSSHPFILEKIEELKNSIDELKSLPEEETVYDLTNNEGIVTAIKEVLILLGVDKNKILTNQ